MEELGDFLRRKATAGNIALVDAQAAAATRNLSLAEVEEQALLLDLMPTRYLRNCLSCAQQLRLLRSRVGVIGCGGLGGTAADLLARLGVGYLRLVDPDVFEEHNLNRQRFATVDTLGQAKAAAACSVILAINPGIRVDAVQAAFAESDIEAVEVVVDGLDSAAKRLQLAEFCRRQGRPLVHGAVREWYGQIGIVTPENDLMAGLYPLSPDASREEPAPKVISPTVAAISSLQAAETCKLLLGIPSPLTDQWLSCNLLASEYEHIPG